MTDATNDGEPLLPDGTYDVFVVDAEVDAGEDGGRVVHLDLTIVSGVHKGELLRVSARGMAGEDYELMGMPGTLTVSDGVPSVRLDT